MILFLYYFNQMYVNQFLVIKHLIDYFYQILFLNVIDNVIQVNLNLIHVMVVIIIYIR